MATEYIHSGISAMPVYSNINNVSSRHFEAIFFYATMGIIITDAAGKISAINPYALNELGYEEKELIGKRIEILVPSRLQNKHSRFHQKYIAQPETRLMGYGRDILALRKDGTEFPAEINLSNYIKNGKQFIIAFINNISSRKKSEAAIKKLHTELEAKVTRRTKDLNFALEQLRQSSASLETAQSFQQALFDNAGAMIIATDANGIIKFFNPEASRSTGYPVAAVVNKHSVLLFHDKREINTRREKLLKEFGQIIDDDFGVLVEKSKRNIHAEERYTFIRKDKTVFPVLLSITSIRNAAGIITGFMGIAIDITEQRKAEEHLLENLKKEKELGELKSRFVTMASHEFRTPLSTVLSSAYLLEKYTKTRDQPKREKHLQRIIGAVSTLTDILNDFLSVGKIEEGKILVRPVHINIRQFITVVMSELKNILKNRQAFYTKHKGAAEIFMDASLLKHIVMNLISNASKFSPEGSPVAISTTLRQGQFILSVKDKGIGISKEDQKHLMERFFRGANAGSIQGTGLGLHIVSKYAELMNGTVACKSELGAGTEFIVTFNEIKL